MTNTIKIWGTIRKQIIARDKICQNCEETGNIMHVHHKDGSGDGLYYERSNNNLDNLILYCPSCHGKIHWREGRMRTKHLEDKDVWLSLNDPIPDKI